MVKAIISDLSEVLIAGLVGIESAIADELALCRADEVLRCFGGQIFHDLLVGKISEDIYLSTIIAREKWQVDTQLLKTIIRSNFHTRVPGTVELLSPLKEKYDLILLSDHAHEWIDYIRGIHPFLEMFQHTFFSFDLRNTKRSENSFRRVLELTGLNAEECLFIDDSQSNVKVAASIGINSIHFTSASELAVELKKRQILP